MSNINIGIDFASGRDIGVMTVFKRPGRIRRLLRKFKLDRSKWEYKVVYSGVPAKKFFKKSWLESPQGNNEGGK